MAAATQVRRPWRATVRTLFQAVIGFAAMWGIVVEALGLDTEWQWVSASLVATAALTRLMAVPQVEAWLLRFVPFLAAEQPEKPEKPAPARGLHLEQD